MRRIPKLNTKARMDGARCESARQSAGVVSTLSTSGTLTSMISSVSAMAKTPSTPGVCEETATKVCPERDLAANEWQAGTNTGTNRDGTDLAGAPATWEDR
jgi:hypothetical protein